MDSHGFCYFLWVTLTSKGTSADWRVCIYPQVNRTSNTEQIPAIRARDSLAGSLLGVLSLEVQFVWSVYL